MIRLHRTLRLTLALGTLSGLAAPLPAQQDPSLLSVRGIYASPEFASERFGPARWLENGAAYTTLEKSEGGKGRDIVRYATESGERTVLVPAAAITAPGDTTALDVEDYSWSPDGTKLLMFTNSQPVWRENNRGDYWVLDRPSARLRKLGGPEAKPSTLLFAKFSPDGSRIGYVRENNIYVENLATGAITQVTIDGSKTLINGTFDWVYEEELDLRDGWRWSPDGQRIAYWQLDTDGVLSFDLINDTDSLYSFVTPVQYPKAGESNSAARVGVVSAAGGATVWLPFDGDPREHYPARMEWANNSSELVVQRLNRLQNTLELFLADATTGQLRTILIERDSAWVYVVNDLKWLKNGQSFTWVSERDGWEHVYLVSRDGQSVRLLTPGAFDVIDVVTIDDKGGWLYYIASPDNVTQRYLWRARLDGKGKAQQVTPPAQAGTHAYNIAPDAAHAWHTYSNISTPPTIDLVRLPTHAPVRTVVANEKLKAKVAALQRGPTEFVKVPIDSGITLNAYVMKPADFDPAKKYPILFQVYGGPGSQTVLDAWGGSQYLWHTLLTQQGYLVASVDNRGTGARGRAWRKIVYGQLGVVETEDQAAAAKAMGRWSYVDSTRIGIWGWSYGGFMSLNVLFRHPDVYRTAVAVAPVTHWKYYDNIYTERYNGLPKDNQKGYDAGSPLSYVDGLRGNLLVIHGSGDDNVHYQNTEALVNKLVAANKPFSMMEYPNRNHGIFGGNTRQHLFDLMTRYLQDNLLAPAAKNYTF
ncbi:MAG: ptpA 11 [Gemmatimonadetes bacterium]|nr:ptpA 11 [Gemmatimonadota bacterium]